MFIPTKELKETLKRVDQTLHDVQLILAHLREAAANIEAITAALRKLVERP